MGEVSVKSDGKSRRNRCVSASRGLATRAACCAEPTRTPSTRAPPSAGTSAPTSSPSTRNRRPRPHTSPPRPSAPTGSTPSRPTTPPATPTTTPADYRSPRRGSPSSRSCPAPGTTRRCSRSAARSARGRAGARLPARFVRLPDRILRILPHFGRAKPKDDRTFGDPRRDEILSDDEVGIVALKPYLIVA